MEENTTQELTEQEFMKKMGDPNFVREMFKSGDDIRDEGLTTPDSITRMDDIVYGADKKWNVLDIYHRKDADPSIAQPTIISIHGGGWVYGDKERYQFYCTDLATRGFTVINFSYRLAPEAPFPAALEDINTLFQWIADNAPLYHINTDELFVVGDSAGAQLASQYLALLTNPEYQKLYDMTFPVDKLHVRACALNCGMYDGKKFPNEAVSGSYFTMPPEEYVPLVDTLNYITSSFPPTYVMTSIYDFLREHAKPFFDLLCEKGIPCEYHCFGHEGQDYMGHVFHLNQRLPEATVCNDAECTFFRSFLNADQ